MKKLFIIVVFVLYGCPMDAVHQIATIKNSSAEDILVMTTFDDSTMINDDMLYYGGSFLIQKDSSESMYTSAYTKNYIGFYFFNARSVINDKRNKKMEGIVNRSFLKRMIIPKASLKEDKLIIFKLNPECYVNRKPN